MYEVQFVGEPPIPLSTFNTTHFNLLQPNTTLSTRSFSHFSREEKFKIAIPFL
jgi:hypothetical protein